MHAVDCKRSLRHIRRNYDFAPAAGGEHPVLLFRMASTVDPSSSDGSYIEAVYNEEKREWVLDREIKHFDTPVDPEVLINSLHPNIRAMFKGTVSEVSEIPDDKLPIDPPEQVPVKIPNKKGAKCKT